MHVLAEHPSELVRDQYVMQVADSLRLDASLLRTQLSETLRRPAVREVPNSPHEYDHAPRPATSAPTPRPGLEALRLKLHAPQLVQDRFIARYFVNGVQREIFVGLETGDSISNIVDALERQGDDESARLLSQMAVEEMARDYTEQDVTAVVSQLLRSAVAEELKNVERDLRSEKLAPDVTMVTVRDVKERLALLETDDGKAAERDLREWLLERASSEAL